MEPITIGTSVIGLIGLIGALITIYFKLKASLDEQIKTIVEIKIDAYEKVDTQRNNKIQLKIQALELGHIYLDNNTVKKEVFAEVSSRLVHIEAALLELKVMIQKQQDRNNN